ncbi:hypothetical protein JB92DRAFT_3103065 [Gautieria morchelliformis]|nr:hypothetical protein JB92DRAFT_3103065 [Gautieria morchelliformis]
MSSSSAYVGDAWSVDGTYFPSDPYGATTVINHPAPPVSSCAYAGPSTQTGPMYEAYFGISFTEEEAALLASNEALLDTRPGPVRHPGPPRLCIDGASHCGMAKSFKATHSEANGSLNAAFNKPNVVYTHEEQHTYVITARYHQHSHWTLTTVQPTQCICKLQRVSPMATYNRMAVAMQEHLGCTIRSTKHVKANMPFKVAQLSMDGINQATGYQPANPSQREGGQNFTQGWVPDQSYGSRPNRAVNNRDHGHASVWNAIQTPHAVTVAKERLDATPRRKNHLGPLSTVPEVTPSSISRPSRGIYTIAPVHLIINHHGRCNYVSPEGEQCRQSLGRMDKSEAALHWLTGHVLQELQAIESKTWKCPRLRS